MEDGEETQKRTFQWKCKRFYFILNHPLSFLLIKNLGHFIEGIFKHCRCGSANIHENNNNKHDNGAKI